ncbi:MAG: magnesium-dependent phosphatase-1 [Bacteroidota bacterium]
MKKIIFAFELDNTLWECGKERHDKLEEPFEKKSVISGLIKDKSGKTLYPYPEIKTILSQIKDCDYTIVFMATTGNPQCTKKLMEITEIDHFPDFTIFSEESKANQINKLLNDTDSDAESIVYFDTSRENAHQARSMGVNTFLIPDEGLTHDTFMMAMKNVSMYMDVERLGITWGSVRES